MDGQRIPVRRRLVLRAVSAAFLGLVAVTAALELGIRFLLFSDSSIARKYGAGLRKAERFGDPRDDDYWKLQDLFLDPARRHSVPGADPVCGWLGSITPGTYVPSEPVDLRGRRPVLLYGDSYAACRTPPVQCFQGLLESSDLADRYCLVNYGVGGYGVDQAYLLLKQSIDRWKDLDPIVVVSFLVQDDFCRNVLTFRGWPKPRLRIIGGELVSDGPVTLDREEFRMRNPIRIRSYLWRLLIFRKGVFPAGVEAWLRDGFRRRAEEVALGRKLLEECHRELESRGLRHFFLEFHARDAFMPWNRDRWADELVEETAAQLGVPVIAARPFLLAAADGSPALAGSRLFLLEDEHYNALGNVAAFEALRQGIEGRFDANDMSRVAGLVRSSRFEGMERRTDTTMLGCAAQIRTLGRSGFARTARVPYPPFAAGAQESREAYLVLAPGEDGPTEVRLAVPQYPSRFRGRAISVPRRGLSRRDPLILTLRIDGRSLEPEQVPFWPDGIDLDVDLRGARHLELAVDRTGPDAGGEWIHIAGARLEQVP